MSLDRLDRCTVTLHTGQTLTLQEHTQELSEYLIKKLDGFTDLYSKTLKDTLSAALGQKWSEVRAALDKMDENINIRAYNCEYDVDMMMTLSEIIYPATDQDDELLQETLQ